MAGVQSATEDAALFIAETKASENGTVEDPSAAALPTVVDVVPPPLGSDDAAALELSGWTGTTDDELDAKYQQLGHSCDSATFATSADGAAATRVSNRTEQWVDRGMSCPAMGSP
jgi:hypothetical protein